MIEAALCGRAPQLPACLRPCVGSVAFIGAPGYFQAMLVVSVCMCVCVCVHARVREGYACVRPFVSAFAYVHACVCVYVYIVTYVSACV